jgi:hypothetical protein
MPFEIPNAELLKGFWLMNGFDELSGIFVNCRSVLS